MNVTKAVVVHQTVDVLPTPQSPREDPLASATARSRSPRPNPFRRDSEVMREVRAAAQQANGEGGPASITSTSSRPRWLRKVQAWLDGRWGIGHKRKPS